MPILTADPRQQPSARNESPAFTREGVSVNDFAGVVVAGLGVAIAVGRGVGLAVAETVGITEGVGLILGVGVVLGVGVAWADARGEGVGLEAV